MKNLKIRIVCGFRKDQTYSIDGDEAHKAYQLFMNPDERAIFKNGLAVIGKDVQRIEPDYQGTMGWNSDHVLQGEDWNEIKLKGIDREIRELMELAKNVAIQQPDKINLPLSEIKLLK